MSVNQLHADGISKIQTEITKQKDCKVKKKKKERKRKRKRKKKGWGDVCSGGNHPAGPYGAHEIILFDAAMATTGRTQYSINVYVYF